MDKNITGWIETHTSAFREICLQGANKTPFEKVLHVAIRFGVTISMLT